MPYTRVKICGITRPEDALHAADEGVDAIGLVFYDKSPRCVTAEQAAEVCKVLPAFVTTVALFKDEAADTIRQVLKQVPLDLLQFHGSESAEFCRQFGKPYIKALGMDMGMDAGMEGDNNVSRLAEAYFDARGLLLDSHAPGAAGGTGESFDWDIVPQDLPQPLILAGGLDVDNVGEAIRAVKPYAVDVSSGVESEKGIKNADLITAFMNKVRDVNGELNGND
jgi:phosphoribosylanthranilate isomerase